jgi:hypothetical protein
MLRVKYQQFGGSPKVQGIFRMYDETGFPISMSFDYLTEKGYEVDWVEAMCDALRQCVFKYDRLVAEIDMLLGENASGVKSMFTLFIMSFSGETIADKAQAMYEEMCSNEALVLSV